MRRRKQRRRLSPCQFVKSVDRNHTLVQCHMPLWKTSQDPSNNQTLSSLNTRAVNMDAAKRLWLNVCNASDHTLKSSDALLTIGNTVYLIEFKAGIRNVNAQTPKNVHEHEIREKMLSSILMLSDLTGRTCKEMRGHIEYLYVLSSQNNMHAHMRRKSQKKQCGADEHEIAGKERSVDTFLYKYKGVFFREAHVLSGTGFDRFIREQLRTSGLRG